MAENAIKIAESYFPDFDVRTLQTVIWELTGFPGFWHIPEQGNTPEECFRFQLQQVKEQLSQGVSLDRQIYEAWDKPLEEMNQRRIQERAYFIWESAGRPEQQSDRFWNQAEEELRKEKDNE